MEENDPTKRFAPDTEAMQGAQTNEIQYDTRILPKKTDSGKKKHRWWVTTLAIGISIASMQVVMWGYRNAQSAYTHNTSSWQRYELPIGFSVELPAKAHPFSAALPKEAMEKFKKVESQMYSTDNLTSMFTHYIFAVDFVIVPNGLEGMARGATEAMKSNVEKESNSSFQYEITTKSADIVRVVGSFSRRPSTTGAEKMNFEQLYIMADNQVWSVLIIYNPEMSWCEKDAKRIRDSILINNKWRYNVSNL